MASGIPAGVIDVGSNTVRLLVARFDDGGPVTLCSGRVRLGLGAELEQLGRVSARKLAEATDAMRTLGALAARHGLEAPEVLVTAPGRQAANARELVAALERGTEAPVRVLSATEEATLSFHGAVAGARQTAWPVAVVDLGGASTEIAVGRPSSGPGVDQVGRPRCAPADDPAAAVPSNRRRGRSTPHASRSPRPSPRSSRPARSRRSPSAAAHAPCASWSARHSDRVSSAALARCSRRRRTRRSRRSMESTGAARRCCSRRR